MPSDSRSTRASTRSAACAASATVSSPGSATAISRAPSPIVSFAGSTPRARARSSMSTKRRGTATASASIPTRVFMSALYGAPVALGWFMRKLALLALLAACGGDDSSSPDAPTGNHPDPMVIPGGGISGGAVDGVVNLYVIDDATRMPVSGATVRVGTVDGTTDATG